VKLRLDEAIQTSKQLLDGKLPHADKTFAYSFFPPVICIRSDLQQGTTVLLYGESTDTTYVVTSDLTGEITFLLNTHSESGIPVEWFLVNEDDELLDRRHLKLGWRIREIPTKTKDLTKAGFRLIDVLKDIRNERTPQWSLSAYNTLMVFGGGVCNAGLEQSNYECLSYIWEGVNARKTFGDYYFCFTPWPPFLNTLFGMPRPNFTSRFCGLSSGHNLYLHQMQFPGVAGNPGTWYTDTIPETIDIVWMKKLKEIGYPTPAQTLGMEPPDLSKKSTYEKEAFDYKYPEGDRITADKLGLTPEECLEGLYLDLNHETPLDEKITPEKVISQGLGRGTKFK
jgi:lambda repressor-like predicted transcriptional regulator